MPRLPTSNVPLKCKILNHTDKEKKKVSNPTPVQNEVNTMSTSKTRHKKEGPTENGLDMVEHHDGLKSKTKKNNKKVTKSHGVPKRHLDINGFALDHDDQLLVSSKPKRQKVVCDELEVLEPLRSSVVASQSSKKDIKYPTLKQHETSPKKGRLKHKLPTKSVSNYCCDLGTEVQMNTKLMAPSSRDSETDAGRSSALFQGRDELHNTVPIDNSSPSLCLPDHIEHAEHSVNISADDILCEMHFGNKCDLNSETSLQHATFIELDKIFEFIGKPNILELNVKAVVPKSMLTGISSNIDRITVLPQNTLPHDQSMQQYETSHLDLQHATTKESDKLDKPEVGALLSDCHNDVQKQVEFSDKPLNSLIFNLNPVVAIKPLPKSVYHAHKLSKVPLSSPPKTNTTVPEDRKSQEGINTQVGFVSQDSTGMENQGEQSCISSVAVDLGSEDEKHDPESSLPEEDSIDDYCDKVDYEPLSEVDGAVISSDEIEEAVIKVLNSHKKTEDTSLTVRSVSLEPLLPSSAENASANASATTLPSVPVKPSVVAPVSSNLSLSHAALVTEKNKSPELSAINEADGTYSEQGTAGDRLGKDHFTEEPSVKKRNKIPEINVMNEDDTHSEQGTAGGELNKDQFTEEPMFQISVEEDADLEECTSADEVNNDGIFDDSDRDSDDDKCFKRIVKYASQGCSSKTDTEMNKMKDVKLHVETSHKSSDSNRSQVCEKPSIKDASPGETFARPALPCSNKMNSLQLDHLISSENHAASTSSGEVHPPKKTVTPDAELWEVCFASLKESCEARLLNKALKESLSLPKTIKTMTNEQKFKILEVLLGACINSISEKLYQILDVVRVYHLWNKNGLSQLILLCKPYETKASAIAMKVFELCEIDRTMLTNRALQALIDMFRLTRNWNLLARLLKFSLQVCNNTNISFSTALLDEVMLHASCLSKKDEKIEQFTSPLVYVLLKLNNNMFQNGLDNLHRFMKFLESLNYANEGVILLQKKYRELCCNVGSSEYMHVNSEAPISPLPSENSWPSLMQRSMFQDRWNDVARLFKSAVQAGHHQVLEVFHQELLATPLLVSTRFDQFLRLVAGPSEDLSGLPMLEYLSLACIGTAVMLEAHNKKQTLIAFEVYKLLSGFNLNYTTILEGLLNSGFLKNYYLFSTCHLTPCNIALHIIQICLQCDESLDAYYVFKEHMWIPSGKCAGEKDFIFRTELLHKLCSSLVRMKDHRRGLEALKILLETLEEDIKGKFLPWLLSEEINKIFNSYLADMLNSSNLESADELYELKLKINHSCLDIHVCTLRAFAIVATQRKDESRIEKFFSCCDMKGIYKVALDKNSTPRCLQLATNFSYCEICHIIDLAIKQLFQEAVELSSAEYEVDKIFSLKILFVEEPVTKLLHLNVIDNIPTSIADSCSRTLQALQSMNLEPCGREVNPQDNSLLISTSSLYKKFLHWLKVNEIEFSPLKKCAMVDNGKKKLHNPTLQSVFEWKPSKNFSHFTKKISEHSFGSSFKLTKKSASLVNNTVSPCEKTILNQDSAFGTPRFDLGKTSRNSPQADGILKKSCPPEEAKYVQFTCKKHKNLKKRKKLGKKKFESKEISKRSTDDLKNISVSICTGSDKERIVSKTPEKPVSHKTSLESPPSLAPAEMGGFSRSSKRYTTPPYGPEAELDAHMESLQSISSAKKIKLNRRSISLSKNRENIACKMNAVGKFMQKNITITKSPSGTDVKQTSYLPTDHCDWLVKVRKYILIQINQKRKDLVGEDATQEADRITNKFIQGMKNRGIERPSRGSYKELIEFVNLNL